MGQDGGVHTSPPRPGRLRLTGYAACQLVAAIPLLVLFVLTVAGGVLMVVWVLGFAILVVVVPLTRWLATRHRLMAADVLGSPLPDPYRPRPPGGALARLRGWATDPMTWRDLAWILWTASFGFVLSLLVVLLLLVAVTAAIWWYGAEPIMRARCAVDRMFLAYGRSEKLEQRVQALTESRAEAVDHSAAELRRIERDLHDGAQARLVALSMTLGLAESLYDTDPAKARRLVSDARSTTGAAIGDLRSVVRGVHPPVLADRGLGGAVEALALDMAIPVDVHVSLPGRPPAPVESALYFAVAECLANIGKHAEAEHAWIRLSYADGVVCALVGDDGRGGATPESGTGLLGVMRRLSAFDGTMRVSSPDRGPTLVTLEVPCALSSPKTTPSSGPA